MRSLYVHFPFCETRCHYCDFYSIAKARARPTDPASFEEALRQEWMQKRSLLTPPLETIFFGGGTPSMTAYESMARAFGSSIVDEPSLSQMVSQDVEWTLEANPSSVTLESFRAFRSLGVNRISLGVQATKPELLKILGRVHSRDGAFLALENVFQAGFSNVSVDLLCGVPGQTLEDLRQAIEDLTAFPIRHLSCYILTLAPHHPMYKDLPNEETQLEHYLYVGKMLEGKGFEHYEISNFAKPGFRSRHNLRYWQGSSYLGLGPSAHSYDADKKRRWKNVSSLHRYARLLSEGKEPLDTEEFLTPQQLDLEKWMLQLRLREGFPRDWLVDPAQKQRAKKFEEEGLLQSLDDRMRLTPRGFALSDHVIKGLATNFTS